MRGNEVAYTRLLHSLVELQPQFVEQFRQALVDGQRERAQRLVHHLKGIAENLGARQLAAAATVLEQAVVAGTPEQDELIQLQGPLQAVCGAVRKQLAGADTALS